MNPSAKNTLLFVLIAFFVIYFIYEARYLLYGSSVQILDPADGVVLTTSQIQVVGLVHDADFVSLNGRKIYVDEEGHFSEQMILAPGLNILTLEAKDRFGRVVEDEHRVTVQ